MLFGLFEFDNERYIARLVLNKEAANFVNDLLEGQWQKFFKDEEGEDLPVKPFYPGMTESEEIISSVELKDLDGIMGAVASGIGVSVCNKPQKDLRHLIAVFSELPKHKGQAVGHF